MDIKDATLMMLSESAGHPAVASIARSVYERLANEEPVDYRLLDDLIGEASGKGVLRALHAKYSPAAYEAIISADPGRDRAAEADQVPAVRRARSTRRRPAAREHLAAALR